MILRDGHGYGTFYANQICAEFSVMIHQNAKININEKEILLLQLVDGTTLSLDGSEIEFLRECIQHYSFQFNV